MGASVVGADPVAVGVAVSVVALVMPLLDEGATVEAQAIAVEATLPGEDAPVAVAFGVLMAVADGVGVPVDEPVVRVAVAACFFTLEGEAAVLVIAGLGVAAEPTGTATNVCRKGRLRGTSRACR